MKYWFDINDVSILTGMSVALVRRWTQTGVIQGVKSINPATDQYVWNYARGDVRRFLQANGMWQYLPLVTKYLVFEDL